MSEEMPRKPQRRRIGGTIEKDATESYDGGRE